VFGTVVEKSCIFLVDTSGSMDEHMDELKKELIRLVWEQLHKHHVQLARSLCFSNRRGVAMLRGAQVWQLGLGLQW